MARGNVEIQGAVARTGAIAPLCALVKEGADEVSSSQVKEGADEVSSSQVKKGADEVSSSQVKTKSSRADEVPRTSPPSIASLPPLGAHSTTIAARSPVLMISLHMTSPHMISLHMTSQVREAAAGALYALATDHNQNKATIAKLGGIEPLVALLAGGGCASLDHVIGEMR